MSKRSSAIILLICLISFFNIIIAQNTKTKNNLDKYWAYRTRLVKYFVKPGSEIGESVVAYARNKNKKAEKGYSVGDQTIDLAWYIGVLATEYALLHQNNQATQSTLNELNYALMAFDRLDRCETYPPWNLKTDTLDGFFHRYDVILEGNPEFFSTEGRNSGLSPKDVWGTKSVGVPTYITTYDNGSGRINYYSASPSQDQVVHLLMGYTLVYKCLPDKKLSFINNKGEECAVNFQAKAVKVIDRIISYYNKNWIIKDPMGKNVERGYNSIMYAYPIAAIGKRMTGKSYDNYWSQSIWAKKLWGLSRMPNWVNDFNSTMALALAALSDTWWDVTPLGRVNNTGFYIDKCGSPWNRETFFLLLFQFINDKETIYYDKDKVLSQIETAPFNGPYYWSQDSIKLDCCGMQSGKPQGGWAFPNKFRGTKKEQDGLGRYPTKGNFSGIDYMLLYNLYHLLENPIPYKKD